MRCATPASRRTTRTRTRCGSRWFRTAAPAAPQRAFKSAARLHAVARERPPTHEVGGFFLKSRRGGWLLPAETLLPIPEDERRAPRQRTPGLRERLAAGERARHADAYPLERLLVRHRRRVVRR